MEKWSETLQTYLNRICKDECELFSVKIDNKTIWRIYCDSLPVNNRSSHDCRQCHVFFDRVASSVFVDQKTGKLQSAIWPGKTDIEFKDIPLIYQTPTLALKELVETSELLGPRDLKPKEIIGMPHSNGYSHLCLTMPDQLKTCQYPAYEVKQNYEMILRCCDDYTTERINTMLEWFTDGKILGRIEVKPAVVWLQTLFTRLKCLGELSVINKYQRNIIWSVAMNVPTGFLHSLRSGMASIILKPIQPGDPDDDEKSRIQKFNEALKPELYQRKQAPPKAGNLKAAEKLFEELGIKDDDWPRRYCRLIEIPESVKNWSDKDTKVHLETRATYSMSDITQSTSKKIALKTLLKIPDSPCQSMTFMKFIKTIIPEAKEIYYYVGTSIPFYALITGETHTYPFMRWHTKENKEDKIEENLVSWYTYPHWRASSECSLKANTWNPVHLICPFPHQWNNKVKIFNLPSIHMIALTNAFDINEKVGGCMFPNFLREDFHPVRSTIEEYNRNGQVKGYEQQDVCGVAYSEDSDASMEFVVRFKSDVIRRFCIDRYE